jgi:hypothetical protein
MFQDMAVIINLNDWLVVYFKGKKFDEGHSLYSRKWIRLGMLLQEAEIDINDIVAIYVDINDVSDESILWDFPENIVDLHSEIKEILNKAL